MTLNQQTIREIAVTNPAAVRVFESFGIDYCCGGGKSLEEACAQQGVPIEKVLESLAAPQPAAAGDADQWQDATLTALIAHIVGKHHGFVRRETPRLLALLQKVQETHGASHRELQPIEEAFDALARELEVHMFKEEKILFPYVQRLEAGSATRPPFGTVANPIRMMVAEHDSAGELLKRIRSASGNFVTPHDVCPTYEVLYRGLEEFERDLHRHVHLENNILFPRAVKLEGKSEMGHGS